MRMLIPFEKGQEEILLGIYSRKRGSIKDEATGVENRVVDIITELYDPIVETYKEYLNSKKTLECLSKSICNDIQKRAMISCYEQSTKYLEHLKSGILLSQKVDMGKLCQFCGINSANTFDHYVPKSVFPEFSVFGPNLIPCCSECNSLKSESWIGENRFFINLYYDSIPNVPIIKAQITIIDDLPVVRFMYLQNEDGSEVYKQYSNCYTIQEHYKRLQLFSRFKDNCNNYLFEIVNSLRIKNKVSQSDVMLHLDEEYSMISDLYGPNHWKSLLVKGLIDCDGFAEWCENKTIHNAR